MTEAVSLAWRLAGNDLGIDVSAPFDLVDDRTQEKVRCVAFVRWFGSLAGTVVLGRHSPSEIARSAAEARGLFFSMLDEHSYATYERGLFIETLDDWGWFGDAAQVPGWFKAEPLRT